jgi:hypothetical protein
VHFSRRERSRALIYSLLDDLEIPLGGVTNPDSMVKKTQLPWTTLPKILAKEGWQLENWPSEVPLPGSGSQSCDDNKGINGLDTKHLSLLYEATESEDHPLRFSKIMPATTSPTSSTSTSGTFVPGLSVRSDTSDVHNRRRDREDDIEGNQRAEKRPRLTRD